MFRWCAYYQKYATFLGRANKFSVDRIEDEEEEETEEEEEETLYSRALSTAHLGPVYLPDAYIREERAGLLESIADEVEESGGEAEAQEAERRQQEDVFEISR